MCLGPFLSPNPSRDLPRVLADLSLVFLPFKPFPTHLSPYLLFPLNACDAENTPLLGGMAAMERTEGSKGGKAIFKARGVRGNTWAEVRGIFLIEEITQRTLPAGILTGS